MNSINLIIYTFKKTSSKKKKKEVKVILFRSFDISIMKKIQITFKVELSIDFVYKEPKFSAINWSYIYNLKLLFLCNFSNT